VREREKEKEREKERERARARARERGREREREAKMPVKTAANRSVMPISHFQLMTYLRQNSGLQVLSSVN